MNGDFAFAVWDRRERELFLARDRFGVRPLFVAELDGDLVFASEQKAILRHPAARRELDPAGLVESFTTWCISPDASSFPGIRELAPAHYLLAGPEGIRAERRWWDLRFSDAPDVSPAERSALAEELDALLGDATRLRLRADVPVAAYLSGGLDSSAIVAHALEQMDETLHAFGIGFEDPRFDESAFQDRLTGSRGLDLTRVTIGARDIAELLPQTVEMAEKPTLRTAPSPLLRLSGAVQDAGLKVVTTGEGADELFGGYDLFRENAVRHFWAREPDSELRPLLLTRLNAFIGKDLRRSGAFLVGFYRKGLTETDDPLYSHRLRFANTSRLLSLLTEDVRGRAAERGDPAERLEARLPDWFGEMTPLGKVQYLEISTFLEGYLLHTQGDRMLMGHSIEGRFPFLDYRVAELAASLPDQLRLRGLTEKYLLRKAVEHRLPAEIAARKKRPYRAPIVGAFVGSTRRTTWASSSTSGASATPGCSRPTPSRASSGSARRARRATPSRRPTRWPSSASSPSCSSTTGSWRARVPPSPSSPTASSWATRCAARTPRRPPPHERPPAARDAARLGGARARARGRRRRPGTALLPGAARPLAAACAGPAGAGRAPGRPGGDLHGQLGRLRDGALRDAPGRRRRSSIVNPQTKEDKLALRPRRLRGDRAPDRGEPHAHGAGRGGLGATA